MANGAMPTDTEMRAATYATPRIDNSMPSRMAFPTQLRLRSCFFLGNAAASLLAVTLFASPCLADLPYPANPMPCESGQLPPDCIASTDFASYAFLPLSSPPVRPNDFHDDWKITSDRTGETAIDSSPQELFGVKGASVDLAWQISTGRPDVLIAVLDSGIRWQDRITDLFDKLYLNRRELPVPEGSSNSIDPWDRNRDGVFNVRDYRANRGYEADSRVSDQNGNRLIDPEDLIFVFSDGRDDDGNGYIDDISGWDFFEDDNDALDEVRYGHGTGESEDSGAEANNNEGGVGTCPNCMLLSLRVGDSFVAEVNNFAQAVLFAVDNGALVIQEALGTLNNTKFAQEAVDYAYRHGVAIIASAADEQSNHHNYPANYAHTIEVNSVTRFISTDDLVQTPRSYLYLNGCTNYGGHIALTVPSSSCSSEATGRSSGMAGLIYSAALNEIDKGRLQPYRAATEEQRAMPLSANEVKQLLTSSADDINFDPNYETMTPFPGVQMSRRFPSIAGWDQFFGYGRVNANTTLRRIAEGKIPPEADITSPTWFEILDPDRTLRVTADVAAVRSASFSYRIEAAPGIQPAESAFEAIAMGSDSMPRQIEADLSSLVTRMPHGIDGPAVDASGLPDPDRFSVTVRVLVTDQQGLIGEDRRVFAIHRDPALKAGTPRFLGGDGVASPVLADVDGDNVDEIVLATSDGFVHAFQGGLDREADGWPVRSNPIEVHSDAPAFAELSIPHAAFLGRPAVGDLDRDGSPEIVAADVRGLVYVWDHTGRLRPGFPVSTLAQYSHTWRSERDLGSQDGRVPDRSNRHNADNRLARGIGAGPALANLDGSQDGSLEIVAGAWDRHVYAWHADGTPVHGWPLLLKDPAKVAAVDPITNEVTLNANANAAMGTKIITTPSLGDVDGDGQIDVIVGVNEEYIENPNAVFSNLTINLYRTSGLLESGNSRLYALSRHGAASGSTPLERGWNPDGFLSGWPVKVATLTTELLPFVGTGINGSPSLADLDNDGRAEIGIFSFVGPAYIFNGAGKSWLGDDPTRRGTPRTLAISGFGAGSNSSDSPAIPGLGGGVLAPFAGAGNGEYFLAPTAGLGKLIDNNIPADQIPSDNQIGAWSIADAQGKPLTGTFVRAFPRVMNDLQFLTTPAVADIDNDGLPEALQGSGVYDVHAFNINGIEPAAWPKFTNGWTVTTPAVGDVDGDGRSEVVSATREGWLFLWQTSGDACAFAPAPLSHHDAFSSGNAQTDARPPAGLRVDRVDSQPGGIIELALPAVPGDDLYCGATAQFDIRIATTPITSESAFAEAVRLQVQESPSLSGRNRSATLKLLAPSNGVPGRGYLAGRTHDEAGNVTATVDLGAVTLLAVPTPTTSPSPTPTPTPSATPTASSSPTPTNTERRTATSTLTMTPRHTPTRSPSLTPTRGSGGGGDGCAVDPTSPRSSALSWLTLGLVLIGLRRFLSAWSGPRASGLGPVISGVWKQQTPKGLRR